MAPPPKKPVDQRLTLTVQTINQMKQAKLAWDEVIKTGQKYHQQLEMVSDASRAFSRAIRLCADQASQVSSADVAKGLMAVVDVHNQLEDNRTLERQCLMENFLIPVKRRVDAERPVLVNWEKEYKKHFERLNSDVKRAEEHSKTVGKKNPSALQAAIENLTISIKEIEVSRQDKLKESLLMDRKKHCFLLTQYLEYVRSELKVFGDALSGLNSGISEWTHLAGSQDQLPDAELINKKQRTFIEIQPGGGGGFEDKNYETDEWGGDDEWDEGGDQGDQNAGYNAGGYGAAPPPPPMGGH
eukprot:Opistho-2@26872